MTNKNTANPKRSDVGFSRKLIKGHIAEAIFERMMQEEDRHTIIPFGYEHTQPMLAQYRKHSLVEKVMDNIAEAPDFVLVSNNKKKVYLVEVKYQRELDMKELQRAAEKLQKRWDESWLFVATPQGFRCSTASAILEQFMPGLLSEKWVSKTRQKEYLNLMNEFIK